MMSSLQQRLLAETSPGSVNPASVDMAMLCARPMPVSSMPSAPDAGDGMRAADLLDAARFGVAADAAELDVDNAAGF